METDLGILLPLWTYATDQGELLDRAVGEVGLDHVTVPAVTGRQTHLRLGLTSAEPFFHTAGGWHFQPTAKVYLAAGVRPAKARWLTAADPLGRLSEHVARLGVRLVPRIDMRALDGLVQREPHLCRRNAWGQEVPPAGACANNPDGRELLRATLEDLRRYDPAGFELVGWLPDSPTLTLPAYVDGRELHDLCFCPACRQIAAREGVDADRAARAVRERCQSSSIGDDDSLLAAYSTARLADWTRWLRGLDQADPRRSYLLVLDLAREEPPPKGLPLPWLARLGETVGGGSELLQTVGDAHGLALRPWRPLFGAAAELVRLISEAVRGGVRFFDFETLDEAPPDAITWMKQAVRYARRG